MRGVTTRTQNGQSTLEYAILIAIVISVLIGMQMYVRRAMMGRSKDVADQQFGKQFDPHSSNLDLTVTSKATRNETTDTGGLSKSQIIGDELNSRTVNNYQNRKLDPNTDAIF